jgi:hypothetical protein
MKPGDCLKIEEVGKEHTIASLSQPGHLKKQSGTKESPATAREGPDDHHR